jgi:hypothetical protein
MHVRTCHNEHAPAKKLAYRTSLQSATLPLRASTAPHQSGLAMPLSNRHSNQSVSYDPVEISELKHGYSRHANDDGPTRGDPEEGKRGEMARSN